MDLPILLALLIAGWPYLDDALGKMHAADRRVFARQNPVN
jgi:hypothetical protein